MKNFMRRHPLLAYVALAYLVTWGIGVVLLASRRDWVGFHVAERWEAAAAFGPLLAAFAVAAVVEGAAGVRALLASMARWRVGAVWIAVSVLSPFALLAAAALILRWTSGAWPDFTALETGRLATAAGLAEFIVISGLVQGLGEEPGWRGFMLPRLRLRFTPLLATLALFPVWLLWHLPAFLGRPQFGLAQWFAFSAGILSAAIWLTLIWERTRSVLMAILWHMLINIARGIALAVSMPMFLAISTLVLIGAVLIAGYWLLRRPAPG
jgi:membrane protease YdiL (CAAX protease family)